MINRSKFKAFLLVGVVFLLGTIVGGSVGTTIVSRKFAAPREVPDSQRLAMVFEKFRSRLKLNPEQSEKVRVILQETHQQFKDLNHSIRPQSDALRMGMRSRVRELLTDDQKKEFEAMTREYDERKAREESS
jgi:hypothetical protein